MLWQALLGFYSFFYFLIFKIIYFTFYVNEYYYFARMSLCVHVHAGSQWRLERVLTSQSCSYRQLGVTMWVLRIKCGSYGKAARVLNQWAISPALLLFLDQNEVNYGSRWARNCLSPFPEHLGLNLNWFWLPVASCSSWTKQLPLGEEKLCVFKIAFIYLSICLCVCQSVCTHMAQNVCRYQRTAWGICFILPCVDPGNWTLVFSLVAGALTGWAISLAQKKCF